MSTQDSLPSATSGPAPAASPIGTYHFNQTVPTQPPSQYAARTPTARMDDGQDQEVTNETAAALFQSPINSPGDALHLLLQASGQSGDIQRHESINRGQFKTESQKPRQTTQTINIDPAITGEGLRHDGSRTARDCLNVYARLRFVRAGWFTAREALSYID